MMRFTLCRNLLCDLKSSLTGAYKTEHLAPASLSSRLTHDNSVHLYNRLSSTRRMSTCNSNWTQGPVRRRPLPYLGSTMRCQSMATMPAMNVQQSTYKLAEQLIVSIKKELKSEQAELEEIATYYFDGQGKAYRPMIVILIGRAFNRHLGQEIELSEAQKVVAMVAEMIHTSSLVHDDVIDSADTRRGKPSINILYGQRKSILAGDYILSRASQMLARLGNEDILVVLSHILLDLVRGEFMQMSTKPGENKRFDHYINKSFKKTASLIAHTCKAVTLLSGANEAQQQAAFEYGRNLGIAFQLVDDLLDFEASQSELGKPAAADLKLGLATAPVLYASAQFEELEAMISRRFSEPGDVERAYDLVMRSDGLAKTKELAKQHVQSALSNISLLSDSEEKRSLITLAEMTIIRRK